MSRLSDWKDELEDLDAEFDEVYESESDDYDDDYEQDYDYDIGGRGGRGMSGKLWIPIAAGVLLIVITLVIFLAGKKESGAVETQSPALQMLPEDTAGETGQENGLNDPEESTEDAAITDIEKDEPRVPEPDSEQPQDETEVLTADEAVAEDPQPASMSTDQGTEVDVTALLSSGSVAETAQVTIGIDVARYQGTIDWAQVAASGIDFAMVRVGYRADQTREICADTNARYNMQEAQRNGIKVGAYFFSTAVNAEEAKAEADWVADYIAGYQITYPVAYDCEGFDKPESSQYHLTNAERTDIALVFLQEIYNRGYTPMFYASMGELSGNAKWDTTRIEGSYRIWVSQYPAVPYPETAKSSYGGTHAMWQYTNRGTVAGIEKPVDVNVAYFGYEGVADAQSGEKPEEAHADAEALMNFTEVNENVTAKDSTNLRSIPDQGEDSAVVYTLKNGETVQRTGVSDSGWSRLIYNGQTVYAVSSYLTTDLNYQTPVQTQEGAGCVDGLKT